MRQSLVLNFDIIDKFVLIEATKTSRVHLQREILLVATLLLYHTLLATCFVSLTFLFVHMLECTFNQGPLCYL